VEKLCVLRMTFMLSVNGGTSSLGIKKVAALKMSKKIL